MERAEIRQAFGIRGNKLAVEDRGRGVNINKHGCDRGKAVCEVVPTAAQQAYLCGHLVELQAPAVELDLMRPARAAGPERGQAWGNIVAPRLRL